MKKIYKIFISYIDTYKDEAIMLENLLKNDRVHVFKADETTAEKMTDNAFDAYAKDAYAFVFLLSKDTLELNFVEREIAYAVENGITIIPIMLEDFELSGAIATYLSNVQRIAVFGKSNEDAMQLVASKIRAIIEREETASYSIIKFFAKKFVYEIKIATKKVLTKLCDIKEKFIKSKPGFFLPFIIQFVASFLVFLYIHLGLSTSNSLSVSEISTMSLPPFALGILFSTISSLTLRKMQRKLWSSVISVALCVVISVMMLLTGFFISQHFFL